MKTPGIDPHTVTYEQAESLGLLDYGNACQTLRLGLLKEIQIAVGSNMSNSEKLTVINAISRREFFAAEHHPGCAETFAAAAETLRQLHNAKRVGDNHCSGNIHILSAAGLFRQAAEAVAKAEKNDPRPEAKCEVITTTPEERARYAAFGALFANLPDPYQEEERKAAVRASSVAA